MENNNQSFIVRISVEEEVDGNPKIWRGTIDHVGTTNRLYFRDLNGMVRFIKERTGIGSNKRPPWWRVIYHRIRREHSRNESNP